MGDIIHKLFQNYKQFKLKMKTNFEHNAHSCFMPRKFEH